MNMITDDDMKDAAEAANTREGEPSRLPRWIVHALNFALIGVFIAATMQF